MRPLIGITSYMKKAEEKHDGEYFYKSIPFYANKVERAGGAPIFLPVMMEDVLTIASRLDGILFSGGEDIAPERYGEEMNGSKEPSLQRDDVELRLFKAFFDLKKPILCICRGAQLMNVFFGGSLIQDIAGKPYIEHACYDSPFDGVHGVSTREGTLARKIFGSDLMVNSLHHQSVKNLGSGLIISANSADGIVEAIERPSYENFMLGVQWHPERLKSDNGKIFKAFVEA